VNFIGRTLILTLCSFFKINISTCPQKRNQKLKRSKLLKRIILQEDIHGIGHMYQDKIIMSNE